MNQKNQVKDIIRSTKRIFKEFLMMANEREEADVSVFKVYKLFILREKTIYTHLNMLRLNNVIFQGLIWCPKSFKFDEQIS